jgi:hypothetical protein
MDLKKLSRGAIILVVSSITSWIGAELDHGNWFGVTSTVLGIVGIFIGIWIAWNIDNFINI